MNRCTTLLLLALSTAACATDSTGPDAQLTASLTCEIPAPLRGTENPATAGSYIVVFKDGVQARATANALADRYGFQAKFIYEHALSGFAATLSEPVLASVRCESAVKYVQHDGVVSADA